MKKLAFLFSVIAFLLINTNATAQTENVWKTLSKLTFKKQYDEMLGFKVDVPVFSDDVKKLSGKEVKVKGYVIPVEGYRSHKEFVFSAYPYSMCFFCGGAGPETVMEVYAKEPIKYSPDPIVLKGKLELNDADVNRLIYTIRDAELVRESQ
ncbi:MAG TPA: hypothetical protein PKC76_05490 [Saprospiraceae bacterium]|nr:hypothetical protein [Saprospiraceae bacterium]HMP23562.1 hypothetical protein [Saprospiraceae bacterium]